MIKVLLVMILILSQASFAEEEVKPLPPLDPAYMGVHSMVLVTRGSKIYASKLSNYKKPHNVQLLYQLENKNLALLQTVKGAQLVTIKPKAFNLQRLMRGEKLVVQADLYTGHYKRDGMLVYEDISLSFDELLYLRTFDDIQPSSNKQNYDFVELKGGYRIYIHRIQEAPSFDHLIGVDIGAGCLASFKTSSAVPKETEIQYKFLNCGTLKPLYFETDTFKAD